MNKQISLKSLYVVALTLLLSFKILAQTSNAFEWSGIMWEEKITREKVGPGGNFFGMSHENITIKKNGSLDLKIVNDNGAYSCAELFSKQKFSYGTYEFYLEYRTARMDTNTVLGLFLFNHDEPPLFNEIDIEFSRWGGKTCTNSQFAIHDDTLSVWKERFDTKKEHRYLLKRIKYSKDSILFESYFCNKKFQDPVKYCTAVYYRRKPVKNPKAQIHINLWLVDGYQPNKKRQKVKISRVEYRPLSNLDKQEEMSVNINQ